ncbi:MAG: peptidoglycan DD-metalloendopeptidase family protein [Betaproteobacteria bacterium]
MNKLILALVPTLILAGCASQPPAPVVERSTPTVSARAPAAPSGQGYYTVKKGDTLYRIALEHGVYYRDIAAWNNITDTNSIKEGMVLRVAPPGAESGAVTTQPIQTGPQVEVRPLGETPAAAPVVSPATNDNVKREPKVNKEPYSDAAWERAQTPASAAAKPAETKAEPKSEAKPAETGAGLVWGWPATGKMTAAFGENGNKGIDIAGRDGDPISAAADGKVFFVGLQKGYGNLLIIGHTNGYISVYAHNRKILVSEKQQVSKGQKVAEMGKSDSENGVKLHFEVRQQGKPVDPLAYLPKR